MKYFGGIVMAMVLLEGAAWAQGYSGQQWGEGGVVVTGLTVMAFMFAVAIGIGGIKSRLDKQNKILGEQNEILGEQNKILGRHEILHSRGQLKQKTLSEDMCKQLDHIATVLDPEGEAFLKSQQHQQMLKVEQSATEKAKMTEQSATEKAKMAEHTARVKNALAKKRAAAQNERQLEQAQGSVQCPHCSSVVTLTGFLPGTRHTCPECGNTILIEDE